MDSTLCVIYCEEEETTNHLFFTYRVAWLVCNTCYLWIDEVSVLCKSTLSLL